MTIKDQILKEFDAICDQLGDHMHPAQYGVLRKLMDKYALAVVEQSVPKEKAENGDNVEDLIHSGWNACRARTLSNARNLLTPTNPNP